MERKHIPCDVITLNLEVYVYTRPNTGGVVLIFTHSLRELSLWGVGNKRFAHEYNVRYVEKRSGWIKFIHLLT